MTTRSTRYEVFAIRQDGTDEMVSCFSRRADAIKRAKSIVGNPAGWPSVTQCYVRDTMPRMVNGQFENTFGRCLRMGA